MNNKKILKKVLSFIFSFVLIFTAVPFFAAGAVTSGTTGDCTWTLDGTVLTISGNIHGMTFHRSPVERT